MTPMTLLRYTLVATALCSALTACTPSRKAGNKDMQRILEEMKGPEVESVEKALVTSAKQAEDAQQYTTAMQFYKQLADKNEKNAEYRFKYAENLRKAGSFDAAIEEYEKLEDDEEYKLAALEGIGLSLMGRGEFEEAGDKLADVMAQDTTRWQTINAIGILFTTKQMYPEARQYFAEALALSPRNVAVRNNMGLMEALDKNYDEAINLLKEAGRVAGKNKKLKMQTDLNLALVYAIKGELELAEKTAAPHLKETQLLNNMGYYAHLANDDMLAKSYLNMALTASNKHYEKAWKNLETMNKLINNAPRKR